MTEKDNFMERKAIKEDITKYLFTFIGPVGYNIWWENSRNGSFGPENGPKMQEYLIFRPPVSRMPDFEPKNYFCIFGPFLGPNDPF